LLLAAAARLANATPIGDKYAQLGGAGGFLGTPTIPETTAPDGIGKFRHYQHGSIYWHPETGAREVHGLIRQRWAQLGWEQSYLGYPITDEIDLVDGSGRVSAVQGRRVDLAQRHESGLRGQVDRPRRRSPVPYRRGVGDRTDQRRDADRQPSRPVRLLLGPELRARSVEGTPDRRHGDGEDRVRRAGTPVRRFEFRQRHRAALRRRAVRVVSAPRAGLVHEGIHEGSADRLPAAGPRMGYASGAGDGDDARRRRRHRHGRRQLSPPLLRHDHARP